MHELILGCYLIDRAVAHYGNAVAETECLIDVVRNIEDGSFIGGEQVEQALFKLALQVRIEGRERFVEHEDRGLGGEHARERHALLLTTGKLQGVALFQSAKPEARELTFDERIALSLEHFTRNARCDIRLHGKVREELVILEQQRALTLLGRKIHGCLLARSLVEIRLAIHDDLARIRRFDTGDAAQRERLAAPRGAQEAERFVRSFKGNFQIEGAVVLLDVDHQTHSSTSLRRYFVVRLLQRLIAKITAKEMMITTIVQKNAASMLPPIHSK